MGRNRPYADIMSFHEGVTGSLNFVVVKFPDGKTMRFGVDCGLFQEREYDDYNSMIPFNAENIDFCLVTHVHVDHIGRLPFIVQKGYSLQISYQKMISRASFLLYIIQVYIILYNNNVFLYH